MDTPTHTPARRRRARLVTFTALWAALLAALLAAPAAAEEFHTLFSAPEVNEDEALFELLLYDIEVNTAQGGATRRHEDIKLDGSDLQLYFTSSGKTSDYSVCLRWAATKAGADTARGHGCFPWLDASPHTHTLASAADAAQADTLTLENFDVKGLPDAWDGQDLPPNMLAHQRAVYALLPAPAPDAPPAPEPAEGAEGAVTRALVERGLRASAKGILKCAHPTGKFFSMVIDHFQSAEAGYLVDFTIYYRCLIGKRACQMSLSATFDAAGTFKDVNITADTAKTDAALGLKACKSLLEVLRR
jgi:hypothetical protein